MLAEILSKISKLEEIRKDIISLSSNLDSLVSDNSNLFSSAISKFDFQYQSNINKFDMLSKLINDKSSSDVLSYNDFLDDSGILENIGFELLSDKTAIKLKAESVENVSSDSTFYITSYNSEKCFVILNFKKETSFNKLLCSFYDGINFILPYDTKYISKGVEFDLLENFERFFDRKLDVENSYFFYPKTAESLKFYFNCSSVNLVIKKISVYLEQFPVNASLVLKYENNLKKEQLVFVNNFYDKFKALNYSFFNGIDYTKLEEKNHKSVFVNPKTSDLFLKISYNSSNITLDKNNVLETVSTSVSPTYTEADYSVKLCGDYENVVTDDTFRISVNLSALKILKEFFPDFATFNNDEIIVSSEFIKILTINDTLPKNTINTLAELTEPELFQFYKKFLFLYSPVTKTLYFANLLNKNNMKFTVHFKKEIYQDVSSINNYTPFLFDMTLL